MRAEPTRRPGDMLGGSPATAPSAQDRAATSPRPATRSLRHDATLRPWPSLPSARRERPDQPRATANTALIEPASGHQQPRRSPPHRLVLVSQNTFSGLNR